MNRAYIQPGYFMDSDHPEVIAYTHQHKGDGTPTEQIVRIYNQIRDQFDYDAFELDLRKESMQASFLLSKSRGYCIEKANLLGACARVLGIPSRLGFANVRNHIGTDNLIAMLGTNLMVFHGYAELWLDEKWVKATPAFNKTLCEKLGVPPLEFDGKKDSIFQISNQNGDEAMEYVHDYGLFAEWPVDLFIKEIKKHYGHLFDKLGNPSPRVLDFLKKRSA